MHKLSHCDECGCDHSLPPAAHCDCVCHGPDEDEIQTDAEALQALSELLTSLAVDLTIINGKVSRLALVVRTFAERLQERHAT
jgi:hypothetical protein